jgi:hypothetical protein
MRRLRFFRSLDPLPKQWAIHVPFGKLKTERLVPIDASACELRGVIRRLAG